MTFNPSEQRDKTGKWTAGGGSADGLPPLMLPEFSGIGSPEYVRERANKIAAQLKFDPSRIDISEDQPTFDLNGKNYHTGGIAETQKPEGEGRIVIYRRNVRASDLDGVLTHEIEHMKFQTVLNRFLDENSKIGKEPGPAPDPEHKYWWGKKGGIEGVMSPDGSLRGDYAAKYPAYTGMQEALHKYSISDDFAPTDGVSPYSYDWWKAWADGTASSTQAIHETLAEIARIKNETGKFPEHMGPRVIEYRAKLNREAINAPDFDGYVAPPSKANIAEGTKRWRELYRMVERLSK